MNKKFVNRLENKNDSEKSSYLEEGLLEKEFAENAAARPDVDRRPVTLLAQEQLWWAVPQRDDLVRVRSFFVLGLRKKQFLARLKKDI